MKQGWEIKKLGEVCETSSGGTPSKTHKEYYEGGNIPWLRSGEVSQGLIYDTELYITAEGLDNSSAKIFPIDTVVIAMYGATVGQVGVLKNAMSTNQAVCGIFPTPKFAPLFLVYYLKAKKSYFLSLAAGGAQPNISQQIIRDTYISIPPREEQERIVEELDCLSGVIEKKREQLKQLDALAQSIFYQMFGDPITNEKGWEVKKLGEVCEDKKKILRASKKCALDDAINYIDISAIDNINNVITIPTPYIFEEAPSRAQQVVQLGDVIVSMVRPNLKNIAIVNCDYDNLIASSGFCVLRARKEMTTPFLFYIVKSDAFTMYLMDRVSGANYPAVRESDITDYITIVPPISLQQEFADKIEAIEKQKELIKKSISETETLFNARMDYYFN